MKEVGKGSETKILAEKIENSRQLLRWEGETKEKKVLIQLKEINQEDAQEVEKLGLKFLNECCWRISESQNLSFTFFLGSAFSPVDHFSELDPFSQISFRDKTQREGRALLFGTEKQERLFGLAKFGEKYDGVKDILVEPGFFALVIFLN